MRDGFEAKVWGEAWDRDLESNDGDAVNEMGAKKLFSVLVPDQGTKPPPLPPFNNPTPEQAFLAKNYDENAKKPDRDPRGAFRNPTELSGAAGIVGPLGSSSFNLPNVERALTEMEVGMGGQALGSSVSADPSRRATGRAGGRPAAAGLSTVATSPTSQHGRPPASPTAVAGSPSPTGGQTQHEVLQNFFQRLLSRDREGANATAPAKTTPPKANGNASGEEEGSS